MIGSKACSKGSICDRWRQFATLYDEATALGVGHVSACAPAVENGKFKNISIYHLGVKAVSRSADRSATAAAAYRAGVQIPDARTRQVHDYTRKRGVVSADMVLPEGAPAWAANHAGLWNAPEAAEKRRDACVALEYEVTLLAELPPEARRDLVAVQPLRFDQQ